MVVLSRLRLNLLRSPLVIPAYRGARTLAISYHYLHTENNSNAFIKAEDKKTDNKQGKWLTLPPFDMTVNGALLGKNIAGRRQAAAEGDASTTTALKWVMRCCPQLPRSLVQKLFRLRQVRRRISEGSKSSKDVQALECQVKRVSAKDSMSFGDTIYLPITVQTLPLEKADCHCSEEEIKFIHDLELYKDSAIIVINKPPGMPVQGGIGIKRSLDELAGTYLRHDFSESPRLILMELKIDFVEVSSFVVKSKGFANQTENKIPFLSKTLCHIMDSCSRSVSGFKEVEYMRLDRDSSGILVLGRTQLSATVLHSIFREKTFNASNIDLKCEKRFLQRKYWALVLGSPRRPQGLISVPLGKVVIDDGKSERITVVEDFSTMSSQHAITEYRVLDSSIHGLTWLELSPLTGRKHQLRVHCAEVLGTPIVGDYKYGWQAHKKWNQVFSSNLEHKVEDCNKKSFPFGLDLERGSISDKQPNLHLHCKKMVLPDVSSALKHAHISSMDYDFEDIKSLKFSAPLPPHMQKSWDILCC